MANPFDSVAAPSGPLAPSTDILEVTPDDDTDLTVTARSFYAEVAGDIRVTTASGNVRTVPVGAFQIIPTVITRVHSTGTTATGIVCLFG
jgi:hypothetical protein